jgi:hypothetical protein
MKCPEYGECRDAEHCQAGGLCCLAVAPSDTGPLEAAITAAARRLTEADR